METNVETVSTEHLSPLYEAIQVNDTLIERNAYKIITHNEEVFCSKEQIEEKLEANVSNHIILYFSDRQISLIYRDKEVELSLNHGELLRYLFLYSKEELPVTKGHVYELFRNLNDSGELSTNTFVQAITRLRRRVNQCEIPTTLIRTGSYQNETAYYYSKEIPFIVIHRSDSSFILHQ